MNKIDPPLYMDNPPEWVWVILDKHDLGLRTDCPQGSVTVLLTDAVNLLKEASLTAFRKRAVTSELRQRIADCRTMIVDAEKLFAFCPTKPAVGSVAEVDDGTLTWSPDAVCPDQRKPSP